MNPSHLLFRVVLAGALTAVPASRAQVVNDGETRTLINVTTNITGTVTVGTNGAFTRLVLSDNALLTNSAHGVIGLNALARSNEVHLVSTSGRWLMGGTLFVGSNGSFSTLVVSNGALVRANAGIIGRQSSSVSNVVFVTGVGSMWSNVAGVTGVGLTVGSQGSGNHLIVSNGGWVVNALGSGSIGSNGSNNVARVTGAGSVWSNSFDLTLRSLGAGNGNNRLVIENGGQVFNQDGSIDGLNGGGNNVAFVTGSGAVWNNRDIYLGSSARAALVVSNGGAVLSANGYVGPNSNQVWITGSGSRWNNENDVVLHRGNTLTTTNGGWLLNSNGYLGGNSPGVLSSSNNTVVVTGAGSTWSNRADLFVGFAGRDNRLVVSNGAIAAANSVSIGFHSTSLDNRVTVDGGALRVTNAAGTGVLDVRRGTNVLNAGLVEVDQLLVTNTAGKFELNGGRLISRGAIITPRFFVGNSVTTPAIWDARGGDHRLASDLFIGNNSPFNQMLVTEGAVINSGRAGLIGGGGGHSNTVFISGPGSQWRLDEEDLLYVGYGGVFNRLIVTNGGFVEAAGCIVGGENNATNCEALITGPGSVLASAFAALQIGSIGSTNRVRVENGGRLMGDFQVGRTVNSVGNLLKVTDPGSRIQSVSQTSGQIVGYDGPASALMISNGGAVQGVEAVIGLNAPSSNNLALVTGSGSVWSNATTLYVGFGGGGNQLLVSDGAALYNSIGTVGSGVSSSNNLAVVTGAGSVWTNLDELYVGRNGRGNQLVVSNGGTVFARFNRYVGENGGANSNSVLVTGAGSAWLGDDSLYVGSGGAFNQLLVNKGGRVTSGPGTIGGLSAAKSNRVEVTDAGSMWINLFDLTVGEAGEANRLVVSNGALIVNSNGIVGFGAAGDGNVALVSGGGSVWRNQQTLTIGDSGSGNQLEVSQGARVDSRLATLGRFASAGNNRAVVTGPGSSWRIEQSVMVGVSGSGNRLVISDGGFVSAGGSGPVLTIGDGLDSANNEVLITGSGSIYSNAAGINIQVGHQGYSNRLRIENGGLLVANPIIGDGQTSTSNVLTVTGPGSRIFVPRDDIELIVGVNGPGNFLVVSNGAAVLGDGAAIGYNAASSNNLVVVTGSGSVWSSQNVVQVGNFGRNNRLLIADGGTVSSTNAVNVGFRTTTSSNNLLHVANGTLRVTNLIGTGRLDIRSGTNRLDAGLIDVDRLVLTNVLGVFEFNGGTVLTRGALINNSPTFSVGNSGGTPAVWDVRAGASDHFVAGSLRVGVESSFNQLILTNGALLTNLGAAFLGSFPVARSNSVTLAGAGSRWRLGDGVVVGDFGSGNRLGVSNGASLITDSFSYLGFELVSTNNEAVVTGPGSSWTSGPGEMFVGYRGRDNRLLVSHGGLVAGFAGTIGDSANSTNNLAVVTGMGSSWSNATVLRVGNDGAANRLVITEGATVFASNEVTVGFNNVTSSNNLIAINGGALRVQNLSGTGTLGIRNGTNRLDAGLMDLDRLVITNVRGEFEFNGGTLRTAGTTIGHGRTLNVGNGASTATLELRGGTHVMLGGLVVANHGSLIGNGSVPGALTVQAGGQLVPGASGASGASIGKINFNASPSLQGTVVMEVNRNGLVLTNDQIQVATALTYGGSLIVSNAGPDALVVGDRFPLFSAASFGGSFATITLPPLGSGLAWMNKLLVDGSIEVVATRQPGFSSISLSGTNLIVAGTNGTPDATYTVLAATNVALPLSNWASLATNQFNASGGFTFTNSIVPGIPQRFFQLRTP